MPLEIWNFILDIKANRQQAVIANYEVKPNVADHKTDTSETIFRGVGF